MRQARISVVNSLRAAASGEDPAAVLQRAGEQIEKAAADRPDLVLLAELFANGPAEHTAEAARKAAQDLGGPICASLSALARRHGMYVAFGLLRRDGERIYNSLVLLGRDGKPAWTYDKVSPVVFEMTGWGVSPGKAPRAFRTDFGTIGAAICFDVNFLELAESWQRQGVELVLFSSAFPAGRLLDAWAIRYGFAVAQSTWYDSNRIIDCTGATVARTSDILPRMTALLNLDRRVLHMDGNIDKVPAITARYGGDVLIDDMRDEALMVITSMRPGLEAADIVREFSLEPLADYLTRSRAVRASSGGLPDPWMR
jgi:predicted amidohydrolase